MLRFKILASALLLLAAAVLARVDFPPGPRPCLAIGEGSIQITALPWQAQSHVAFTDEPKLSTVRVQITDNAEAADFTLLDDADSSQDNACAVGAMTRYVAISARPSKSEPIIYLSEDGPADYRIFVHSQRLTAREAAALIVGANSAPRRVAGSF